MLPGILHRQNHAVNAPAAKASGHDDAVQRRELRVQILCRQMLGINPINGHMDIQGIAGVMQGFCHGKIRIVELHIFADQPDAHLLFPVLDPLHHGCPFRQIRRRCLQPQFPADHLGKMRFLQHQRRFVQAGNGHVFNDAIPLHIAKQRDLFENGFFQRLIAAQHDDIGMNAHALQLLHGMLGGLGFMLVRAPQEGHQRHMDKQAVFPAHFQGNLPNGFQKGLGFDVADGAADLGNYHVGVRPLAHAIYKFLDFIGDVGNHLHREAQIFAPALPVEHIPVYLAGGEIGVLIQILVNKALIVAQIQVGFRAVLGHIHLAMLIGAHGAGVHIDVGIQLLRGHFQPPGLEQPAQRSGGDALAQAGNHTAGYEDILGHCSPSDADECGCILNGFLGILVFPEHLCRNSGHGPAQRHALLLQIAMGFRLGKAQLPLQLRFGLTDERLICGIGLARLPLLLPLDQRLNGGGQLGRIYRQSHAKNMRIPAKLPIFRFGQGQHFCLSLQIVIELVGRPVRQLRAA